MEREKYLEIFEELSAIVPDNAANRLDEILNQWIDANYDEVSTSRLAISMILAYKTYIDGNFETVFSIKKGEK